jgi:hypothetical protein
MKFHPLSLLLLLLLTAFAACEDPRPVPPDCNVSDLAIAVDAVVDAACEVPEGSITVSATGGAGAYQYQLDSTGFQANNQFANLLSGTYQLSVKDADGCTAETEAYIPNGLLLTDVRDIINANCAISECHDGSIAERQNLKIEDRILSSANDIREKILEGEMPPQDSNPTMTGAEKDLIVCWVNDGAKK